MKLIYLGLILLIIIYMTTIYTNINFFTTNLGKFAAIVLILFATYINIRAGFIILVGFLLLYKYQFQVPYIQAFVINLDKNVDRFRQLAKQIDVCDLFVPPSSITIQRFPAINGNAMDLSEVISGKIIAEINTIEKTKHRTHHHQLTRGGVGCFTSHLILYKTLVEDKRNNMYLIMEDDVILPANFKAHVDYSLKNAPNDWDILLFTWIRLGSQKTAEPAIDRVKFFWGMQCYMINSRGAGAIIDEVANGIPIDGQIDSYLSRMILQRKLVVYTYNKKVVSENSRETDIQIPLLIDNTVDPFDYGGYVMR